MRKESKRKKRRERETQTLATMEDGYIWSQNRRYDLIVLALSNCFPKLTFIVIKIKILPITTPDLKIYLNLEVLVSRRYRKWSEFCIYYRNEWRKKTQQSES